MQLQQLAHVLRSQTGRIQLAVVYDAARGHDLEDCCSVEYAVKHYGHLTLNRIQADGDLLVLGVTEADA